MKGKHTPGPWYIWNEDLELNPDTSTGFPLICAAGETSDDESVDICEVNADYPANYVANARLIAAAPELLEALKGIVACASINGPVGTKAYIISDERRDKAKAAIARAEGTD